MHYLSGGKTVNNSGYGAGYGLGLVTARAVTDADNKLKSYGSAVTEWVAVTEAVTANDLGKRPKSYGVTAQRPYSSFIGKKRVSNNSRIRARARARECAFLPGEKCGRLCGWSDPDSHRCRLVDEVPAGVDAREWYLLQLAGLAGEVG